MTLTELRYIVAVARERHFGRAAEACFVSQPTLSTGIRKLEEELGVALFERNVNEVTVTPLGEHIVEQAQRVLEGTATIKEMAQQGKDPLTGPLRLGVIYTVGPYILPRLIPILHKRAPHMPLLIEENYTARLSELLKQGEVDVIIISLPFDEPGIVTRAVYDEPFQVVFPADHAWKTKRVIRPRELVEENLLMLGAGHCFREQVLQACPELNRSNLTPSSIQRSLEGSSLETIRHMVASGAGVTVLPCTSMIVQQAENKLLAVRPFPTPAPQRRVALAWRKSFPRPQAVEVIRKAIHSCSLPCVTMLEAPPALAKE